MLLSKKISNAASQKSTRKTLEKLLGEVFSKGKTSPFKVSKDTSTLLISTAATIDRFLVTNSWQADASSQLHKTLKQTVDTSEPAPTGSINAALHEYVALHQAISPKHRPMHTLPFNRTYTMSGNMWHNGNSYELAVKGAPEHILAICDLTENERETAERKFHQLAGAGDRVVAFAHTVLDHEITSFGDLTKKDTLIFDGFVSLTPHLSPRIKEVVKIAQKADITAYLMTGDHSESALHIANELNIATRKSQVFDSRRAHIMSGEELEELTKNIRVFSRITPETKTRIAGLFKKDETLNLVTKVIK